MLQRGFQTNHIALLDRDRQMETLKFVIEAIQEWCDRLVSSRFKAPEHYIFRSIHMKTPIGWDTHTPTLRVDGSTVYSDNVSMASIDERTIEFVSHLQSSYNAQPTVLPPLLYGLPDGLKKPPSHQTALRLGVSLVWNGASPATAAMFHSRAEQPNPPIVHVYECAGTGIPAMAEVRFVIAAISDAPPALPDNQSGIFTSGSVAAPTQHSTSHAEDRMRSVHQPVAPVELAVFSVIRIAMATFMGSPIGDAVEN